MCKIRGYEWGVEEGARGNWHRLRPIGSPSWHVMNSIAAVYSSRFDRNAVDYCGPRRWRASVAYKFGGRGQSREGFTSLAAAKAWAESQLGATDVPATADLPLGGIPESCYNF